MEIKEEDRNTYDRHHKLCTSLNMDKAAADEAWKSYVAMKQNYTLEGDQLHWLCCALYVACRSSQTPTVGNPTIYFEGNLVSLTRLLRQCNLSLIHFFKKCKKWTDMANLPQEFRTKFDLLERKYEVSKVIFIKYKQMFLDIFNDPVPEVYQHKSKKSRNFPCSTSKLFNFCWTLYITIKGSFAAVAVDLVSSYHLLLACCDLIYSNALLSDRRDLLNPNFEGLPANYNDRNYVPPEEANSIIDVLCKKHDGISVEAKGVQKYCWKNHVSELFEKKILKGNPECFTDLLDPLNFESNFKEINKVYDKYTLSVGEFDERIFLSDEANEDIGTLDNLETATLKRKMSNSDLGMRQLATQTPLTGRRWLKNEERTTRNTPLATATQSVTRLKAMLENRKPEPSESLNRIFESCSKNPKDMIESILTDLACRFSAAYKETTDQSIPNDKVSASVFCEEKLSLAKRLFYKWLEGILHDEKKIKPEFNVDAILSQSVVHQCLFACCLEIVIYIYNSQKTFPWILTSLKIESYYFYRVIEMVLRVEDQMPRDVVKHLSMVEENILESIVWHSGSPLWSAIKNYQNTAQIPVCEDVLLRSQIMDENQFQTILGGTPGSFMHVSNSNQSPGASLSERFSSPVTNDYTKSIRSDHSFVHNGASADSSATASDNKPKRTGSLGIFFRKFYNLSSVRMQDICMKLGISDFALMKKIWTCFEYCIVNHIELMQDRHLDQILMCSIYVICKVVHTILHPTERSFMEIMKCYRFQPQAASHVYRSVLLSKNVSGSNNENVDSTDAVHTAPLTPNSLACSSTNYNNQERGDLIKFYNSVYVTTVQNYVTRFRSNQQQDATNQLLSPIPKGRSTPKIPMKRVSQKHPVYLISQKHSVYITPFDKLDSPVKLTPGSPGLTYCVNQSPAKDLHAINNLISSEACKGVKRKLTDFEEITTVQQVQNVDACKRRIQNMLEDRVGQAH